MGVFGNLLFAAWTLLHLYVFGRALTVTAIRRRIPPRVLLGGAGALWASFALVRFAGHGRGGGFLGRVELIDLGALAVLFLLPALRRLRAPYGVFAVTGNHEYHGGGDANSQFLGQAGIPTLHDAWVELRPGLVLAGVDDLTSRRRTGGGKEAVARALAGLMLSGHTHGGQIWPFGYLVRRVYPLLAGRYEVGGMTVLVSRGAGAWGPRMRLWRPAEILAVTLRHGYP